MKFLMILLLYFYKCSGDSGIYNQNDHVTAIRYAEELVSTTADPDNGIITIKFSGDSDVYHRNPHVTANYNEEELVITDPDNETKTSARTTSTEIMPEKTISTDTESTQKLILYVRVTDQSNGEANNSVKSSTTPTPTHLQVVQLKNHQSISDNVYATTAEPRCPALPQGIYISTLDIVMIVLSMLILIVIIICLLYALYKAKSSGYKYMPNDNIQTVTVTPRGAFSSQKSQDKSSPTVVQLEEITIVNTSPKPMGSVRDVTRNNLSPTSSSSTRDSKVLRLIRNNPQTNLILRKQIEEICQGVLNNPISIRKRSPNEFSGKGLAREKSMSSPQLDLLYDTLPSSKQKHSIRSSSSNIDTETLHEELVSNKIPTENCKDKPGKASENDEEIPIYDNPQMRPVPHEIDDIPVYDSVPSHSPNFKVYNDNKISIKVVAENGDNLLVLDFNHKENKSEPTYENSKKNEYMF